MRTCLLPLILTLAALGGCQSSRLCELEGRRAFEDAVARENYRPLEVRCTTWGNLTECNEAKATGSTDAREAEAQAIKACRRRP